MQRRQDPADPSRGGQPLRSLKIAATLPIVVFLYGLLVLPLHLDDAYITARYARNLAAGNGFVYNQGERVLGTTSPLLALIQAGAMTALPDEVAFRVVSSAMLAAASLALLLFGARLGQPLAGFAAACFLPVTDFSFPMFGNEFTLCIALFLTSALLVHSRRGFLAGIAAGLLGLARGEGLLYAGLLGVWLLRRAGVRRTLRYAAGACAILLPWFLFSRFYYGHWFPQTLAAKRFQGEFSNYLAGTWECFASYWLSWPSLVAPAAWLGAALLWRPAGRILLAWAVVHTAAYILLDAPAGFPWYQYPVIALTAWSVGCSLEVLHAAAVRTGWGRALPRRARTIRHALIATTLAAAAVLAVSRHVGDTKPADSWEGCRYDVYRRLGEFLAANAADGDVLQTWEIGITGFYAWPLALRDAHSLIHRDMDREMWGNGNAIGLKYEPEWLVKYFADADLLVYADKNRLIAYDREETFSAPLFQATLHRRMPRPYPQGWDEGFYEEEDWAGITVRWTKRAAAFALPDTLESGRFQARVHYYVGHDRVDPDEPVAVRISINDGDPVISKHREQGQYETTLRLDAETTGTIRIEVSPTWVSPEGRLLGVGVFPVVIEAIGSP